MTRTALTESQLLSVVESNPQHAFAHQQLSQISLNNKQFKNAEHHAVMTLLNNPANGMAMMVLTELSERKKDDSLAYQSVQLGERLWPAHDQVQWLIANYWVRKNRLYKAMSAWNIVLMQEPAKENFQDTPAARFIFPIFERLAKNTTTRRLFDDYLIARPYWWMEFYEYLQEKPTNYQIVNYFYKKMSETRPHTKEIVDDFLAYLTKTGRWNKAYALWKSEYVNYKVGITGLINNGGFESNSFNNLFSWNIANHRNVNVLIDSFSHAEGKNSLKISLNNWISTYWGYVWQVFVLPEGRYQLQFKARASLDSVRGFKWRIDCNNGKNKNQQLLAVSQEIRDATQWKSHSIIFKVPRGKACLSQKMYLITAGSDKKSQRVRGDVWFDSFSLRRL